MLVPNAIFTIFRAIRSKKWVMKCIDAMPDCLTLWFASVWELITCSGMYTCALYSLPFCMSTNRSMILTNFAIRLKVIMLGNVLCSMCVILVALASTVITMFMADPMYREHPVYFGFFLYVFSGIISSSLMVVFLVIINNEILLLNRRNVIFYAFSQNVTKSLYVCIYHDMRTNGIDLPLTVLQNINMYVMEVQMYAQQNLGLDVPPDQIVGGINPQIMAELQNLPPGGEDDLNALRLMGMNADEDDELYDA